jgi:prepilin-type processing-associated H-X9-DG protein
LADITDGTSSTLLLSEVIIYPDENLRDRRGDFMNDGNGATVFQTLDTPNAGIDVITDAIACQDWPPLMPCAPGANGRIAARSRHPGGVNVALCDGSVRFLPNDIPLLLWQNLSTIDDGQPASPDL